MFRVEMLFKMISASKSFDALRAIWRSNFQIICYSSLLNIFLFHHFFTLVQLWCPSIGECDFSLSLIIYRCFHLLRSLKQSCNVFKRLIKSFVQYIFSCVIDFWYPKQIENWIMLCVISSADFSSKYRVTATVSFNFLELCNNKEKICWRFVLSPKLCVWSCFVHKQALSYSYWSLSSKSAEICVVPYRRTL
jgi:hypothetical protein